MMNILAKNFAIGLKVQEEIGWGGIPSNAYWYIFTSLEQSPDSATGYIYRAYIQTDSGAYSTSYASTRPDLLCRWRRNFLHVSVRLFRRLSIVHSSRRLLPNL